MGVNNPAWANKGPDIQIADLCWWFGNTQNEEKNKRNRIVVKTQISAKKSSYFLFICTFFLRISDISAFLLPVSIKHFHKPIHDDSYITLFRDGEYSIEKYI